MKYSKNIEKVLSMKDIELLSSYKKGNAVAVLVKDKSNGAIIFQTSKENWVQFNEETLREKVTARGWELV